MGLAMGSSVDRTKIHGSPRLPVLLGDHMYPAAPRHGGVVGDKFQYPETDVTFDVLAHFLLPVGGDGRWSMHSDQNCILLHENAEGIRPFHHWEWLMFAGIESTCCIVLS